mmetsp:Transcript_38577/g.96607  ORF Transcript_38577/g.96607 Transcript_38577/m.96607 type:complete len:320 (+) Transcript_38577:1451-2410(+)
MHGCLAVSVSRQMTLQLILKLLQLRFEHCDLLVLGLQALLDLLETEVQDVLELLQSRHLGLHVTKPLLSGAQGVFSLALLLLEVHDEPLEVLHLAHERGRLAAVDVLVPLVLLPLLLHELQAFEQHLLVLLQRVGLHLQLVHLLTSSGAQRGHFMVVVGLFGGQHGLIFLLEEEAYLLVFVDLLVLLPHPPDPRGDDGRLLVVEVLSQPLQRVSRPFLGVLLLLTQCQELLSLKSQFPLIEGLELRSGGHVRRLHSVKGQEGLTLLGRCQALQRLVARCESIQLFLVLFAGGLDALLEVLFHLIHAICELVLEVDILIL